MGRFQETKFRLGWSSSEDRSYEQSTERAVNMYSETRGAHRTSQNIMVGRDGLRPVITLENVQASGRVRGMAFTESKLIIVVSNFIAVLDRNDVERAARGAASVSLTDDHIVYREVPLTGFVSIDTLDETAIAVISSQTIFIDATSGTARRVTSGILPNSSYVTVHDRFAVLTSRDGRYVWNSEFGNLEAYEELAFFRPEFTSDPVIRVIKHREFLVAFGSKSIEYWYTASGVASPSPFRRSRINAIERGALHGDTIAEANEGVFFVGDDNRVYLTSSSQNIQVLSNWYVENILKERGEYDDFNAYIIRENEHVMYCLNVGHRPTLVFDLSTRLWHERSTSSIESPWTAWSGRWAWGYNFMMCGEEGTSEPCVGVLDRNVYDDNGKDIIRVMQSPVMESDGNRIAYSEVVVNFESGPRGLMPDDAEPQAYLSWSDNFGRTWSSELGRTIGKIGQSEKRTIWRRLGQARFRVFRLRMTERVKWIVLWSMARMKVRS